jgi:ABC-type dipeptide/oligopeptide/nickel transport system ATPase subunit
MKVFLKSTPILQFTSSVLSTQPIHNGFIKSCLAYSIRDKRFKYFIIITMLNGIAIRLIISELIIRLSSSESNFWLLKYYLGILVLSPIIGDFITPPLITNIVSNIQFSFVKDSLERYNRLSFDSKISRSYSSFEQILNPASWALRGLIDWGVPNLVSLMSSLFCVWWTFYNKQMLTELFIVIGFFAIIYKFVIRRIELSYTAIHKKNRKIRHQITARIQLNGIGFQYKEITPEFMIGMHQTIFTNDNMIEMAWSKVSGITNFLSQLSSAIIIWICCKNYSDFMLFAYVLIQFSSSIIQANHFITQFNRLKNDFENFVDFWKGSEEINEPKKLYIESQSQIQIKSVDIKRNDYSIHLNPIFRDFSIRQGMKILIEGPSGHGKSSFVKSLFGLVSGSKVDLSFGEGKNYYHQVSDYFQEIKGVMPITKVSIQDIFKGETNFVKIREYLINAWGDEEHQRICDSLLSSSTSDSDDESTELIKTRTYITVHPYQVEIKGKLSGGQISRMILWQRGFDADTNSKSIIILDEPIPDVDFSNYIDNLQRFYTKYQHKLIIMIGHLCECKRIALNADQFFDMELWIENGLINRRR